MTDADAIRELAKAAGYAGDLTDAQVLAIRRKLANAFVDNVLDQEGPGPDLDRCTGARKDIPGEKQP